MNEKAETIGPLGVIDVGAHSMRLEIVQPHDGEFEPLEDLSYPVPLGRDVFLDGKIHIENASLVERILKDFSRVLDEYNVRHCTAVATSAVREAQNRDMFLDRIRQRTSIDLQLLEGPEEIRLIYLAVADALKSRHPITSGSSIIYTIGTGSSQLCFLKDGQMQHADTIRLGTLRLVEEQLDEKLSPKRLNEIVDPFVAEMLSGVARMSPDVTPERLIAVGAPVRGLLALDRSRMPAKVGTISRDRFEDLFAELSGKSDAELVKVYGLPDTVAKSMEPCCHMLEHLFEITQAPRLEIPMINTRDALAEDMVRRIKGDPDPFIPHILSSARALGERYRYDADHARNVSRHVTALFDELKELHALPDRWRLLLAVAAEIHDIGLFISGRGHHKHSYYLVRNSMIPGISAAEQELLGVLVRYHRKAMPKASHLEYTSLMPDRRVEVSKAAAILRVADALDRSHRGKIRSLHAKVEPKRVTLRVSAPGDLTFERWGLSRKGDLFEEVFGHRVILAPAGA